MQQRKAIKKEEDQEKELTNKEKEPFTITIQDLAPRAITVKVDQEMHTLNDLRGLIHRTFSVPQIRT